MKSPNGPVLRPYIKLHLYPFKAAKKKTQPIEAGTDLNPVFDNHFQFKVSFNVCARPVKVASDFGPCVWYFRSTSGQTPGENFFRDIFIAPNVAT